jgi:hypothetical protein
MSVNKKIKIKMGKQPEKQKLVLVVPDSFEGVVQVVRPDGKVLYESTLPTSEQNMMGDDSSNPGGPPPPPPGGQ